MVMSSPAAMAPFAARAAPEPPPSSPAEVSVPTLALMKLLACAVFPVPSLVYTEIGLVVNTCVPLKFGFDPICLFRSKLLILSIERLPLLGRYRTVGGLGGQRDGAVQQGGNLGQRAVGHLQRSNAVIRVVRRLCQCAMLACKPLAIASPAASSAPLLIRDPEESAIVRFAVNCW